MRSDTSDGSTLVCLRISLRTSASMTSWAVSRSGPRLALERQVLRAEQMTTSSGHFPSFFGDEDLGGCEMR